MRLPKPPSHLDVCASGEDRTSHRPATRHRRGWRLVSRRSPLALILLLWLIPADFVAAVGFIDPFGNTYPPDSHYTTRKEARWACETAQPMTTVGGNLAPGYDGPGPDGTVCAETPAGFQRIYHLCHTYMSEPSCWIPDGFGSADVHGPISFLVLKRPKCTNCRCRDDDDCRGDGPDVGNPVSAGDGNKYQLQTDYRSPDGSLSFGHTYSSLVANHDPNATGWSASFSASVEPNADGDPDSLVVHWDDGSMALFVKDLAFGTWQGDPDAKVSLTQDANGYTVSFRNGSRDHFDPAGRLASLTDTSGRTTQVTRDGAGRAATVIGPFGHTLNFSYNQDGRIATLTDPAGQITAYGYDSLGNVASVTYPDNAIRTYHY